MNLLFIYGILTFLGLVFPFAEIAPWLWEHGLDISVMFAEASTPVAAFAWLDILFAALACLVFIFCEGRRLSMKYYWVAFLGTCLVGVSFGLPLFLLLREWHFQNL